METQVLSWMEIEKVALATTRMLLIGAPGLGKTSLGFRTAKALNRPVYSVTIHQDLAVQELIGFEKPVSGTLKWHDGPVSAALRTDGLLILNEVDDASSAVLRMLFNVLDDPSLVQLMLPTCEVLRPGKEFRVLATSNVETDMLPEPLLDRFEVIVKATEPHPEAVALLDDEWKTLVQNAYESGDPRITIRKALAVKHLIEKGLDLQLAGRSVFGPAWQEIHVALEVAKA